MTGCEVYVNTDNGYKTEEFNLIKERIGLISPPMSVHRLFAYIDE